MKHRPSSLPILDQCSCFESGGPQDFTNLGTDRHAAFREHFAGDDGLLNLLDEEDQEAIRWAAEYVRVHAPMADHPIVWETKRYWDGPDFEEREGTPDVVCGQVIFDFKWRRRNYDAQMADYALSLFPTDCSGFVTAHLLFGAEKKAQVIKFDFDTAQNLVFGILKQASDPQKQPKACDYCGWCSKRLTCAAMVEPAKAAALGYTDQDSGQIGIANWHPSQMQDPEQIALGLTIWRTVLKKWGDSMEFHAMESATKLGLKLPGFELKERQGKKYIADVKAAFELIGLPADVFLKACDVRISSSKTIADKIGLDKLVAETKGLKITTAKKEVENTLSPVIQRAKSTMSLVSLKGEQESE